MTKIEKSVVIEAPLDKVYSFATDWRNIARYFVYVREVKPITEKTVGEGAQFAVRIKFLGMMWNSQWEQIEYTENEGMAFITPLMGVRPVKRWSFTSVDDSTRVNFILEYKMPIPLLGQLLDVLIFRRQWDKLSEKTFQKLKQLIETEQ